MFSTRGDVRVISAALGSSSKPYLSHEEPPPDALPFVTISCQPGLQGMTLAQTLVTRLNELDPAEQRWTCWDRELVEKVIAEHNVSEDVIEHLEESDHPWLTDFLSGLASVSAPGEEAVVFRHVATTIRLLAGGGRVVLVGRGGVYLTHNMPGGVHVRVVAPTGYRVANLARQLSLNAAAAQAELNRLDHNQQLFFKRYFPRYTLMPEAFTVTINAAATTEARMAAAVMGLVPLRAPAHVATFREEA